MASYKYEFLNFIAYLSWIWICVLRKHNSRSSTLALFLYKINMLYVVCFSFVLCMSISFLKLFLGYIGFSKNTPVGTMNEWFNEWMNLSVEVSVKAMATHFSTLAWKIPWMEEPGGLQSMGSLRVRHDWATSLWLFACMHGRRKWQPTPVFLPGESQGWGSLVGCRLWGCTELDTTDAT